MSVMLRCEIVFVSTCAWTGVALSLVRFWVWIGAARGWGFIVGNRTDVGSVTLGGEIAPVGEVKSTELVVTWLGWSVAACGGAGVK